MAAGEASIRTEESTEYASLGVAQPGSDIPAKIELKSPNGSTGQLELSTRLTASNRQAALKRKVSTQADKQGFSVLLPTPPFSKVFTVASDFGRLIDCAPE